MEIKRRKLGGILQSERGFTLPELLTTIAILGILLAIAMVIWNSIIESRRVDAAANQLTSDMRLAHTRATNQLTDWRVVLAPEEVKEGDGPDYYLLRLNSPYGENGDPEVERTVSRTFPANVKIRNHDASLNDQQASDSWWAEGPVVELPETTRTLEFNSDGSMLAYEGPSGTVKVSIDEGPEREITFLAATSRIEIE